MNRRQTQVGFILILLALFTGFAIPFSANPRLALAAHVVGVTGGLILIAIGALAQHFRLGRRSMATMMACWTYAAYANWAGCLIAAATGASGLTPIAGAGTTGTALAESVVAFLLQSLAAASIVGTVLAVRGFRSGATASVPAALESHVTNPLS